MLKKDLLKTPGIYLVTDRKALKGKDFLSIISDSLKAGVDIIQYRDKDASDRDFFITGQKIKNVLKGRNALFIVCDRVDHALALDSDGVHLGQDDLPIEIARKVLGKDKIIGLSTHSLREIKEASKKDVDYISVGPVFSTPTKPDYRPVGLGLVREAARRLDIPFVAIGGINIGNIDSVIKAGAKRVSVVRAILSSDKPYVAAKRLVERLQ